MDLHTTWIICIYILPINYRTVRPVAEWFAVRKYLCLHMLLDWFIQLFFLLLLVRLPVYVFTIFGWINTRCFLYFSLYLLCILVGLATYNLALNYRAMRSAADCCGLLRAPHIFSLIKFVDVFTETSRYFQLFWVDLYKQYVFFLHPLDLSTS